jgi:tRNA (adenine-N(1)-)-methyltransferase non-catalytic subunit
VKDFFLKIDPAEEDDAELASADGEPATRKAQKTEDGQRITTDIQNYEVKGDNRNITDDTTKQLVQEAEINEMRARGADGREIIDSLIQNSSTFNSKTQFSKEKWLKKKMQKYMVTFEVKEAGYMELCDLYF